jgi:chromosomal replication initiation ATPase DnaA
VKWEDVTRHFQLKPLTKLNDAKHTFMYIAHRHLKYTCEQIAKMCNRHHATVLSACKKIDGFYQVGDDVISKIEAIKTKLHEAETN